MSKKVLREAVKVINQEKGTTVMLTTHDMDDIEAVCNRLILIDRGKKLFDGTPEAFRQRYTKGTAVKLEFGGGILREETPAGYRVAERTEHTLLLVTEQKASADAMIELIGWYHPQNIYVTEPRIEDIVQEIFSREEKD